MTDDWITPLWILRPLGAPAGFDLDPCVSETQPWPTAARGYSWRDNGLAQPWFGRVWCNMPYSNIAPWLARMAAHDQGTALTFAKTDTRAFMTHVFDAAAAVFWLQGRVRFNLPDGRPAPMAARHPSVLIAYGRRDAEILADCGIEGRFEPLRLPRLLAVGALDQTWMAALAEWFDRQSGPVRLADLYRAFAARPKARRNRTYQATIRRTLQEGPFERVGRGLWERAA